MPYNHASPYPRLHLEYANVEWLPDDGKLLCCLVDVNPPVHTANRHRLHESQQIEYIKLSKVANSQEGISKLERKNDMEANARRFSEIPPTPIRKSYLSLPVRWTLLSHSSDRSSLVLGLAPAPAGSHSIEIGS